MKPPLWLDVDPKPEFRDGEAVFTVSFAVCRNCGRVKVLSDPCGFDHLAAILEFNAAREATDAE